LATTGLSNQEEDPTEGAAALSNSSADNNPPSCSGSVTASRDFFNRPSSTSPLSAVGLFCCRSGMVSCFPTTKRRRVRPRLIGKLDLRLVAAVAVSAMVGRLALWRLAAMVGRLLDRRMNSGLLRGRSFLPPAKRVNFTLKFFIEDFASSVFLKGQCHEMDIFLKV
jgi:hypothetical protein